MKDGSFSSYISIDSWNDAFNSQEALDRIWESLKSINGSFVSTLTLFSHRPQFNKLKGAAHHQCTVGLIEVLVFNSATLAQFVWKVSENTVETRLQRNRNLILPLACSGSCVESIHPKGRFSFWNLVGGDLARWWKRDREKGVLELLEYRKSSFPRSRLSDCRMRLLLEGDLVRHEHKNYTTVLLLCRVDILLSDSYYNLSLWVAKTSTDCPHVITFSVTHTQEKWGHNAFVPNGSIFESDLLMLL